MSVKGLPNAATRAALIDELGELERQRAVFKPKVDRALELQKIIASWYEHLPAEQEFEAEGKCYTAQITPKAVKRSIFDMARVFALLGKAKFLEVAEVGLKVLDREIPREQHGEFMEESRDGRRSVKLIAKAVVVARKAA